MDRFPGSGIGFYDRLEIVIHDRYPVFERTGLLCHIDHRLFHQVAKGIDVFPVFREIHFGLKDNRRYLEFNAEQFISRLMITFDRTVAGQETIGTHVELLVAHLHDERCAQVNEVGVPDIGEQCI